MDRQQDFWNKEHRNKSSIPSMHAQLHDRGVEYFYEFLKRLDAEISVAADIGCGKGRNSIFMANNGSVVYSMEFVESALGFLEKSSKELGLSDRIHLVKSRMDRDWPFKGYFFNVIIDSYSSIDIDNEQGRNKCKDEMFRTLKLGGYALVMVVSCEDELEKEFIANHPGPEKNSCIWPNGKFQKNYDKEELIHFYSDFNIVEIKEIKKPAIRLGRNYTATNYWLILQKPNS